MRSPSQRWRLSIVEWTPPRQVTFTISRVAVSTARGSPSTSKEIRPLKPGIADELDRRVRLEPAGELRRASRSGGASRTSSVVEAAQERARRVGRGREAERACALRSRRSSLLGIAVTVAPSSASWWPVRYFVAEWRTTSAPSSSALQVDGRREGRVADDEAAMGAQRPPSRAASAPGSPAPRPRRRRRPAAAPVWSNSTTSRPQRRELRERDAGPVVRALGERDGHAGAAEGEHARRDGADVPEPKSSAVAAFERAERALRGGARSGGA